MFVSALGIHEGANPERPRMMHGALMDANATALLLLPLCRINSRTVCSARTMQRKCSADD